MNPSELYQEVLLDHCRRPHNRGELESATHSAEGYNAMCGDEISLALRVEDDTIREAKFTGTACAICTASVSILTCRVAGLSCEKAKHLAASFRQMAKDGEVPGEEALHPSLVALSGVHRFPQRVKCAVLPWETLVMALTQGKTANF
jgi:nitrogen fixation NifU-like protein